jgi:hypothetical protein
MSGEMIDFRHGAKLIPARGALDALLTWTEPARARLGIEVDLPARNGAERALESLASGASVEEVYGEAVEATKRTYTADVGARR